MSEPLLPPKRVKLPPIEENQRKRAPPPQQQIQEEDEEERKKEQLQPPPNHQSAMTHMTYFQDPHYKECYPTGAKLGHMFSSMLTCKSWKNTYVEELKQLDIKTPEAQVLSEKEKNELTDRIITLKVLQTSAMELDTNVMHPFVRIHIVNMVTGTYVQKSDVATNAVYNFESNCVIEVRDDNKERKSCELELITAFATNCCDMRNAGSNSRAIWNEEIEINESAEYLYTPETIILFELLDFQPMYLNAIMDEKLDQDHFYRIAWGFLRPLGLAKMHQGTVRVQLYKYIFDTRKLIKSYRKESTPLVYFEFIFPAKEEYNAVLNVLLKLTPKPDFEDVYEQSKSVFQIEKGDRDLKKKFHSTIDHKFEEQEVEDMTDQDKQNLRRRRFYGEKCQIPTTIAKKFASAPLGCYRLAFNKKGNYLAAACTYKNSKTIIKLFDVEGMFLFGSLKGHRNLVHDIQFSPNSLFLCTSSADFTTKIWKVPKHSGETVDEDESDHYLLTMLEHPSYVYCGVFLTESPIPLVVSGCFDSRLRIWKCEVKFNLTVQQVPEQQEVVSVSGNTFDGFEDLLDHRHPNTLVFDGSRRLYVGDSLGAIHIYDINATMNASYIANRISFILNPEMSGDAINCLRLVPPEMKDLLVHSRDNCLRLLEINSSEGKYSDTGASTGQIVGRFFGSTSQKLCVRSTPSPCGEYILSGSEDGNPHLWDNVSITQPTEQFQYSVIGPVSDVVWNDNYHMIALGAFGDEHPIVIYIWERNEAMELQQYKELQEKLITQQKKKYEDEENQDQEEQYSPPSNLNQIRLQGQQQQPFGNSQPFANTEPFKPNMPFQTPFGQQSQPVGEESVNQQEMARRPYFQQ